MKSMSDWSLPWGLRAAFLGDPASKGPAGQFLGIGPILKGPDEDGKQANQIDEILFRGYPGEKWGEWNRRIQGGGMPKPRGKGPMKRLGQPFWALQPGTN